MLMILSKEEEGKLWRDKYINACRAGKLAWARAIATDQGVSVDTIEYGLKLVPEMGRSHMRVGG